MLAGIALMSSVATASHAASPKANHALATTTNTFSIGDKTFLLDGKPFIVKAAEIHYPRIPRQYWGRSASRCARPLA